MSNIQFLMRSSIWWTFESRCTLCCSTQNLIEYTNWDNVWYILKSNYWESLIHINKEMVIDASHNGWDSHQLKIGSSVSKRWAESPIDALPVHLETQQVKCILCFIIEPNWLGRVIHYCDTPFIWLQVAQNFQVFTN